MRDTYAGEEARVPLGFGRAQRSTVCPVACHSPRRTATDRGDGRELALADRLQIMGDAKPRLIDGSFDQPPHLRQALAELPYTCGANPKRELRIQKSAGK